jgi:hypothetical protein
MGKLKKIILAIAILGIVLSLLPLLSQWYVLRWLENQGYQAKVKSVSIDFIFAELHLRGLKLTSARREQLDILDLQVQFSWPSLIRGDWVIQAFKVERAQLNLAEDLGEGLQADSGFKLALTQWQPQFRAQIRSAEFNHLELCRTSKKCLRLEYLSAATAELAHDDSGWSFSHQSPLSIKNMYWRSPTQPSPQIYVAEMKLGKGSLASNMFRAQDIEIHNFQYLENSTSGAPAEIPYQSHWGQLKTTSLELGLHEGLKLALGATEVTTWRQVLHRNADSTWAVPDIIKDMLSQPGGLGVQWSSGPIKLRDGSVSWVDFSVMPAARMNGSELMIDIGKLDMQQPQQPTLLEIKGKLQPTGSLKVAMDLYPFAANKQFTFDGYVDEADLTQLSGYSRAWLGQAIEGGQVSVSASAVVRDGQIKADSRWQFANWLLAGSNGSTPLALSYNMLKDHNNSFTVVLPLQTRFDANLPLGQQVGRQLNRVINDSARRRLSTAGAVNPSGGRVTFKPLSYEPNQQYLGKNSQQELQELAVMLKEKPHLKMNFCPVVTAGEWAALFNGGEPAPSPEAILDDHKRLMIELADTRGRILRNRMMELGAAANQLVICKSRLDMTQSGLSFITISL